MFVVCFFVGDFFWVFFFKVFRYMVLFAVFFFPSHFECIKGKTRSKNVNAFYLFIHRVILKKEVHKVDLFCKRLRNIVPICSSDLIITCVKYLMSFNIQR